jgi:hypothetical protein
MEESMANGIQEKPDEWRLISTYSRSQAIEDGELFDVTQAAREVGFIHPTALTRAVWERYVKVPEAVPWQDQRGRLHDVVWMARCAASRALDESSVTFALLVDNDGNGPQKVNLKAVVGPGDLGEPVITIMTPDED